MYVCKSHGLSCIYSQKRTTSAECAYNSAFRFHTTFEFWSKMKLFSDSAREIAQLKLQF